MKMSSILDHGAELLAVLRHARQFDASDIHLIAGLPPAFRIHGEMITIETELITRERCQQFVDELLNEEQKQHLSKHRSLCVSLEEETIGRFRASLYYRAGSPEMSIRVCAENIPTAEELGLPDCIDTFARKPNGLILITGPTGSGKTTTLHYMLDLINRERRCKIITIEDPIEYVHHCNKAIVVQQEIHTDCLDFGSALRSVLRQDPDIIAIGEMRDMDTISTALTAAETGHLVLATLHTPNVFQTVERVVGAFPSEQQQQAVLQLANCLQAVVAQNLLPKAGEEGRVLGYEVMIANAAVRKMIRDNQLHLINNVIQTNRKDGMRLMEHSLLELYQQGKITYDTAISKARNPDIITKAPGLNNKRSDFAKLGLS